MGGGGQLALNQLLIVDGRRRQPAVHPPRLHEQDQPAPRRAVHRPAQDRAGARCACRSRSRAATRSTSSARRTSRSTQLDPALTRPGRMGRHVWFRTPTKQDRLDIFDLYLAKVAHDAELDRPERRDEIARITSGYSPGDDRAGLLARADVRAPRGQGGVRVARTSSRRWSTLESGTAIGVDYVPGETRAVAIHEAGPRGRRSRLHEGPRVDASVDPHARRLARPPPGAREGGALQPLPQRGDRPDHLGPRLDGGRARLLRRERRTASAATSSPSRPRRRGWSARRAWGRSASSSNGVTRRNGHPRKRLPADEQRAEIMRRFEEIGIHIMNRASTGDVGAQPDRAGARRPRQAAHGRADHRPGVHEGAPPDALQQGQGRRTSPTS